MIMKQTIAGAALCAAIGLVGATAHAADVNVGINIGTPAPVVVAPAPVVVAPGWYGERYWDGHRYWARDEWEEHHHHGHGPDFCPPGHAKKGEC